MESETVFICLISMVFLADKVLASENSHANSRDVEVTDSRSNIPHSLKGYTFDVCMFSEVAIACEPNYVVSEVTAELHNPGYCGCFRHDLMGMSQFLKTRCIGSVSCKALLGELKLLYDLGTHPPENCGYKRQIRYNCEPAQSLCKGETDKQVSHYSSHINLLSPGYPHSYPGNRRPSLVCATQLFLTSDPQHDVTTNLRMNVVYLDMDLLDGEYVVMCYNNILHIGATYDDLGSKPTEDCHDASKSFQMYKSLQIVYHYHNNPYQFSKGVLIKVSGVSPRAIIEVRYVDFQKLTTPAPTVIPPDPNTKRQVRSGIVSTTTDFQSFTTNVPEEDEEYMKTNITTTQENTPSVKHLYTGTLLTLIIVGSVVLILLVLFLAAVCLWRRQHSSWKSTVDHTATFLGCKSRTVSIPEAPERLSSRPSSGSTINPYAFSMTSPPANQYTEPSNVYVNTGSQRTSSSLYRGSDEVYDDVQAQRLSLMCKEPPYDNHIMVQALQRGETCPLKQSHEEPVKASPTTSKGGSDNVEELYTKPAAFKKKIEDDGYNSCNSTTSVPLQEGENLLVENELYHSKNNTQM